MGQWDWWFKREPEPDVTFPENQSLREALADYCETLYQSRIPLIFQGPGRRNGAPRLAFDLEELQEISAGLIWNGFIAVGGRRGRDHRVEPVPVYVRAKHPNPAPTNKADLMEMMNGWWVEAFLRWWQSQGDIEPDDPE